MNSVNDLSPTVIVAVNLNNTVLPLFGLFTASFNKRALDEPSPIGAVFARDRYITETNRD